MPHIATVLILGSLLQAGRAEFQFPTFPIGPRVTALGRAGVAVPSDAAADLNPAAAVGSARFSLQRFEGYAGYGGTLVAGNVSILRRVTLAMSARRFAWSNVIEDDLGPGTLTLGADQTEGVATVAISLGDRVVVGGRASYLVANILEVVTAGTSLSAGAIVRYASHGSLGVALRDAGAPVRPHGGDTSYPLPTRVRVGIAESIHIASQRFGLVADAEAHTRTRMSASYSAGVEWMVHPLFRLRAGYENAGSPDVSGIREVHLSGGVGIRLWAFDLGLAVRSAGASQGYELLLGIDAVRP